MAKPNTQRAVASSKIPFTKNIKVSVAVNESEQPTALPYDSLLTFSRKLWPERPPRSGPIYGPDGAKILRSIETKGMDQVSKITLVAARTRGGIALWDTMCNFVSHEGISMCSYVVDGDYMPIPQQRIAATMSFQSHEFSKVRTHLNQVLEGDHLGFGIFDASTNRTHIFVYRIDSECVVRNPDSNDRQARALSAINLGLETYIEFDARGRGRIVNLKEGEVTDYPEAFVQRLFDSARNFKESYPWKPHFLPKEVAGWDRDAVIADIKNTIGENHEMGSYDEFLEICREVHKQCASLRSAPKPNEPSGTNGAPVVVSPPLVRIIALGSGSLIGIIVNPNITEDNENVYLFSKESVVENAPIENALINADLNPVTIDQNTDVLTISEADLGDTAVVRHFEVSF